MNSNLAGIATALLLAMPLLGAQTPAPVPPFRPWKAPTSSAGVRR